MPNKVVLKQIKKELGEQSRFDGPFNYNLDTDGGVNEAMGYLTTVRNRSLITPEQQGLLRVKKVAFLGLSVGSNAVRSWVMATRPDQIIISDPDTISPTNLNRLPAEWEDLGKKKVDFCKKDVGRIHPSCEITTFFGSELSIIDEIIELKPDIIVEEIDDFNAKLYVRKLCRKYGIPLVSVTDVGNNVISDVERYDKEPQPEPFLGRVKSFDLDTLDINSLTPKQRMQLTMEVVGFDACSEAMIDSLLGMGKTLKTWPQLGSTAIIAGGVVATTLMKILLGEPVESGRVVINLDELLTPNTDNAGRDNKISELKKLLGM